MKYSILYVVFVAAPLFAGAQSLVADIRPGSASSNPNYSVILNNKLFFVANDGSHGKELYSYDGVNPPTMVYDLFPNAPHGVDTPASALVDFRMGVLNNKIYFGGNDGTKGVELYSYDGTQPAPVLASDIYTGPTGSRPFGFVSTGGKLYFSATDPSYGREVFAYDGATVNVVDAVPGLDGSNPSGIAACNNKIYFAGQTFTEGYEPYEYDPATGIVKMLAAINSGTGDSNPCYFTEFGGKVYFLAFEYQHGFELYSYSGTVPTRLTDLISGINAGVVNITVYNSTLMLSASTDGVTYQLHSFNTTTKTATNVDPVNGPNATSPNNFFAYNGELYFAASDPALGRELFRYDGTSISMVMDINPGAGSSEPSDFTVLNGQLTFTADNGTNGRELFKIGTANAVEQVSFAGTAVAYPNPATGDCTLKLSLKQAGSIALKLNDATGKTVYSGKAQFFPASESTISIPMGTLAAGNYFYALYNENGRILTGGKLVKQ